MYTSLGKTNHFKLYAFKNNCRCPVLVCVCSPIHFVLCVQLGAHMRRASAELEKRRASLGATRGLRSDGTLDPYHAAILFRDSRGVSKERTPLYKYIIHTSIYDNFSALLATWPIAIFYVVLNQFDGTARVHWLCVNRLRQVLIGHTVYY